VHLYENTFDIEYLKLAQKLADYSIAHFYDKEKGYFYFNSDEDPALVIRKIEKSDNVIPASNSAICRALFELGTLMYNKEYLTISDQLLSNSENLMTEHLPYASNWSIQLLNRSHNFYEVAIVGKDADQMRNDLQKNYLPNSLFLGSTAENTELELLESKWMEDQTTVYVCLDQMCKAPTSDLSKAMEQLVKE